MTAQAKQAAGRKPADDQESVARLRRSEQGSPLPLDGPLVLPPELTRVGAQPSGRSPHPVTPELYLG